MEALQAIPESIRRLISLSATLFIGSGIAVLILIQESISTIIKTTLKLTKPIWSRVLPSPVRKALLKWMEPRIVVSDVLGRKVDPAQVPSFLKNPELGRHKTMRTSDGYKLHYVIKDAQKKTKGKSQLLICLHGFPEFWYPWIPFLQHFSSHYTVVALDMRGYGQSDKPAHSWFDTSAFTLKRLAKDVDELVTELGFSKTSIISHDWGGVVSWEFAHEYPQRMERLAVAAAPHPKAFTANISLNQLLKSWYMVLFQVPLIPEWYLTKDECHAMAWGPFLSKQMGPRRREDVSLQDIEAYAWNAMQPGMCSAVLSYYRELFRDLVPTRSVGKTPGDILVFVPEKDGALSPNLFRDLDKYCDNVKVKHLKDCSHWVLYDALKELITECYDFFDIPVADRHDDVHFFKHKIFKTRESVTPVLGIVQERLAEWRGEHSRS
eukprot:gb/GECG01009021.1/.p1 GENE.gb/GECG01009021.1/~~gb/GECG01009021.1/.p1  ORF type:complete len:436 (+),score=40.81 gb/GECG01009021.1/:1-1308(+)